MLGRARAWARPRCLSGLPWHLGTTENTMGTTGAKHINVHRTHIIGRMLPNTSHGCHQFSEYEYSLHPWYFYAARAMNTRNCLTRGKHEILLSAHAHSSPPLLAISLEGLQAANSQIVGNCASIGRSFPHPEYL
jgi:hypothetical protein